VAGKVGADVPKGSPAAPGRDRKLSVTDRARQIERGGGGAGIGLGIMIRGNRVGVRATIGEVVRTKATDAVESSLRGAGTSREEVVSHSAGEWTSVTVVSNKAVDLCRADGAEVVTKIRIPGLVSKRLRRFLPRLPAWSIESRRR